MQQMCTVLSTLTATQDHKCTFVHAPQGLGRHMTSVKERSVQQAGGRELWCFRSLHTLLGLSPFPPRHKLCLISCCQSQYTHSPFPCTRHSWTCNLELLEQVDTTGSFHGVRIQSGTSLSGRIYVQTGLNCNDTLHVGAWSPCFVETSRDSSRRPAQ